MMMKREIKKNRKEEQNQKKVLYNTIAHHLLTSAQPILQWRSAPPSHFIPVRSLGMPFYGP